MPPIQLVFFKDAAGEAPVAEWLRKLRVTDRRGYAKCVAAIERLATFGHELRRPSADYLRDGIYELRARHGHMNYRILYFFYGRNLAVLTQGLAKEDIVPDADIQRTIKWKELYEKNPQAHTHQE